MDETDIYDVSDTFLNLDDCDNLIEYIGSDTDMSTTIIKYPKSTTPEICS